ncbi:MAG: alpha/beta hydrolase fold domain-containing protein [bacterium]|nr:alpha/beta hydrolase fold domain-containing protein [bacterium]
MNRESDIFIASIPPGQQARQAHAVRAAIQGDRTELDKIRASRDIEKPLLSGVSRRMVREDLCLYLPESGTARETLVYLHGGCWTFGGINSCSTFCMAVARKGVAVLAYAYPLAPENDARTIVARTGEAMRWAMEHASEWGGAPEAVSVGGDSAGGNLSLAVALAAPCDRRPKSLLLYYPVVHAWADEGGSWARYGKGFGLDADLMEAGNEAFANGNSHDPLISPDCASDDELKNLPPCRFLAAERDILFDQGLAFHRRLLSLGVPSTHETVAGATHLFVTVPGQPTAFARAVQFAVTGLTP